MRAFLVLSYLLLLSISSADLTSNDGIGMKRIAHGNGQFSNLHPDILRRIFTISQHDFKSHPNYRLVSKKWRDVADQSHDLWKFHIKKSCEQEVGTELLFETNRLALGSIENDSPCLEAILNATDFISARSGQSISIKSLIWLVSNPTCSQSFAFARIFERLAPSLESLTMENSHFLCVSSGSANPWLYYQLLVRIKRAFQSLDPESLVTLNFHATPVAVAFLRTAQSTGASEFVEAIARLRKLSGTRISLLPILRSSPPALMAQWAELTTNMLRALLGKPLKSLWLQQEPGATPANDAPAIMEILSNFTSTLETLTIDVLHSGTIIEYLSEARLTNEFTKLQYLLINDPQWNRPLPQYFVEDILRLPKLEKLALPAMHASDIWEWKRNKEKADRLESLHFNGSPQMFVNIWTVGFRVASVSDGERRILAYNTPSLLFHDNHFIQAREYDGSVDNFLPNGPGDARFQYLSSLILRRIKGAFVLRLIQKLQFLPNLKFLGLIIINDILYDPQLGVVWSDSLLIDLMASSSMEKLHISLIKPMSNPLELLCIVESLAGKKDLSKVSEVTFGMIMPMGIRFQNIKEVLVKSLPALLEQTSLKRFRLHLGLEKVLSWQKAF